MRDEIGTPPSKAHEIASMMAFAAGRNGDTNEQRQRAQLNPAGRLLDPVVYPRVPNSQLQSDGSAAALLRY